MRYGRAVLKRSSILITKRAARTLRRLPVCFRNSRAVEASIHRLAAMMRLAGLPVFRKQTAISLKSLRPFS